MIPITVLVSTPQLLMDNKGVMFWFEVCCLHDELERVTPGSMKKRN